jgi:hypothetical protein
MSWTAINISVLFVTALIYGFCHEKELIQFEHNLYVAIIKALRKRLKLHTMRGLYEIKKETENYIIIKEKK